MFPPVTDLSAMSCPVPFLSRATSELSRPGRRSANRARLLDGRLGTGVACVARMTTTSLPSLAAAPPPAPVARALPVSITDRVARGFPPLACVRGFRYFSRRRVTLSNVSESGLDADVRGKRTLQVRLRVDEGRLAAACTCSAKVLGPARCRHVWATLLEADRQALLAPLRATARTLALIPLLPGDAAPGPKRPTAARAQAKRRARAKPAA